MDDLRTDRLILRAFRSDDAAALARILGQWSVARHLTRVPHPYEDADARAFIARSDGKRVYAVVLGDAVIGMVSINPHLGYYLDPAYHKHGYATEAARALIADYFATDADVLVSGYHLDNPASAHVLSKLGFIAQGDRIVFSAAHDCEVPLRDMQLTRAAWDALQV